MPCTYHFKKKPGLLIEVFWGNVTLSEALSMYDRLLADPKLPNARFEYSDLSGIEETNLDARSMKKPFDILSGQYLRRLNTFELRRRFFQPLEGVRQGKFDIGLTAARKHMSK